MSTSNITSFCTKFESLTSRLGLFRVSCCYISSSNRKSSFHSLDIPLQLHLHTEYHIPFLDKFEPLTSLAWWKFQRLIFLSCFEFYQEVFCFIHLVFLPLHCHSPSIKQTWMSCLQLCLKFQQEILWTGGCSHQAMVIRHDLFGLVSLSFDGLVQASRDVWYQHVNQSWHKENEVLKRQKC